MEIEGRAPRDLPMAGHSAARGIGFRKRTRLQTNARQSARVPFAWRARRFRVARFDRRRLFNVPREHGRQTRSSPRGRATGVCRYEFFVHWLSFGRLEFSRSLSDFTRAATI